MIESTSRQAPSTPEHSSAPYQLEKHGFTQMKDHWRGVDFLEARSLPLETRLELSDRCLADADYCHTLLSNPQSQLSWAHLRPDGKLPGQVRTWEINLRLQSAYVVPEVMDDRRADGLVEASMLMIKELGPRWKHNFHDLSTINRIHDAMALDALWKSRSATTENGKQVAKAMHGSVIMSGVQEIVAFSKKLEQSHGTISRGETNAALGGLGELMKVSWERLNVYINEDPEVIGRVFVRSATMFEDEKAPQRPDRKNRSSDAAIHNLDRGAARALQYKTVSENYADTEGLKRKIEASYDKVITIDYIEGIGLAVADIVTIARHFDLLVKGKASLEERQNARAVLSSYFDKPQVASMSG